MANVLGELFGDIASAIREKTGDGQTMKPLDFPEKIIGISTGTDVSDVTATAADVLEGKTFVDASSKEVNGSMPNKGAYNYSLYVGDSQLVIPEGYHSGNGIVKTVCRSRTVTPAKETQRIIGSDSPVYVQQPNGITMPVYPFLSDVTVNPIPDQYQDVSKVTAAAEDVLEGKVFVDAEGNEIIGTLVMEEAPTPTVDEIWAGSGTSNSLAGSGIIRYVTFMNHDGTVEYGKKSVIKGENCVDPVTSGFLDMPTRESTPQYSYTYAGWATQPNGGLDSNALKAVTDDRTVYANFVSVLRYYTVTFYDSDGTTVLATKSVAYGSVPSYEPSKQGLTFSNWIPEPVAVTGATSYQAVWVDKPNFQNSDWATIKQVCDEGKASEYFKVGDKRPITLTYADGTSETINFTIVDMGVDKKADNTMAALTIMADNQVKNSLTPIKSSGSEIFHGCDNAKAFFAEILSAMPADLQAVVAEVKRDILYGTKTKVFIATEVNLTNKYTCNSSYNTHNTTYIIPYKRYAYFANGASIKRTKLASDTADNYWTSTVANISNGNFYFSAIDGTTAMTSFQHGKNASHGIVPCFCI